MLDWLIVGAGLHGRFIADAIQRAAPAVELALLDPAEPLAAWQARADACGMHYLRSSNAHHLGATANSLRRFATTHDFDAGHQLGYYRRPSRALFESHALATLGTPAQIPARAVRIEAAGAHWRVSTDDDATYLARRVVLATGPHRLHRPAAMADAEHVFDPGFALGEPGPRLAIVGGGITGAQLALRAAEAGHSVCWVTRTPPRPAVFDSDPCYAGPRCLQPFWNTPLTLRSALLRTARKPGTLPPDVLARITADLAAGQIGWQCADAVGLNDRGVLFGDGRQLAADRIVLATGFCNRPASDSLLGRCIADLSAGPGRGLGLGLGMDEDGHLSISADLEAAPGLHVAGRPASLQLGPMAGNIKGARLAGAALAAVARRDASRAYANASGTY